MLRTNAAVDFRALNARKGHGLLELNRALRPLRGRALEPATLQRLESLRAELDANRAVLGMHLQAVREITTVVSEAIREAESDGTYSAEIRTDTART